MAGKGVLTEGRQESRRVEGAKYPPVGWKPPDRQPRPSGPAAVSTTRRPKLLRRPSPSAEATHADDKDPRGNPYPVVFHEYGPAPTVTKTLLNAADMSGADTEPDVIMMSGNWYCDVSTDGGGSWDAAGSDDGLPEYVRWRVLLRPDRHLRPVDRPVRLVPAVQQGRRRTGCLPHRRGVGRLGPQRPDVMDLLGLRRRRLRGGIERHGLSGPVLLGHVPVRQHRRVLGRRPTGGADSVGGHRVRRLDRLRLHGSDAVNHRLGAGIWCSRTRAQAVWVGHQSNSKLQVFTMPDSGNTYSSFTVPVTTWPNGTLSSVGPDGNDWLTKLANFPNFAVTGGVELANGHVVLAWSASAGKGSSNGFNFPNAHARVVEIDMAAHTVASEMQVWNKDYAFAYPVLAANAKDEVGIMLGWGGPNDHANCAMGIIGDFVVWFRDGSTRTVQRYGDYLTTRPAHRKPDAVSGRGATTSPR